MGLEGLPVASDEVWAFDALRRDPHLNDLAGLVVAWLLVIATAALAAWGGSMTLAILAAIGFSLTTWWTATKAATWRATRRHLRRIADDQR